MKVGDLRRFKEGLTGSARCQQLRGHTFVVLETATSETARWVTFLIDGRIEGGWGGDWVESNSEVIDESR